MFVPFIQPPRNTANVEDDFTAAEQKELDRLLAKKETRARRATADPTLEVR